MMALGAIRAVGDAGLNVPADVSVIGFDDIQLADHMNPPLTTVRQDKAGLGVAAGSALVRLIDGEETDSTVLAVELVRRGSTRPRAAD
jgi:LacI family transcriptional regulator